MQSSYIFTSESVSEGHPDKVCDRISDSLLDHFLTVDPNARVAIETLATTNTVVLAGEVRSNTEVSRQTLENVARKAVKEIGYEQEGFSWKTLNIQSFIHAQSADIARGVDAALNKDEGAGDQGIMFGYACDETPQLMPAPLFYAHKILQLLAEARHSRLADKLGPDAKSQVSIAYENNRPMRCTSLVLSTQHAGNLEQDEVKAIVLPVLEQAIPQGWMCDERALYINPTGRFVIGGPDGDAGLTGRKIIVDTYGGASPHGGGAFSGKDPTKVDRSAAYAMRYLAKNVVAAGLAKRCCIQVSYAIGVAYPLSLYVNTYGTNEVDEGKIAETLRALMNLSPRGIREHLKLNRPIYARTSAYGHFGREPEADGGFSWEKLDLVDALKSAF